MKLIGIIREIDVGNLLLKTRGFQWKPITIYLFNMMTLEVGVAG